MTVQSNSARPLWSWWDTSKMQLWQCLQRAVLLKDSSSYSLADIEHAVVFIRSSTSNWAAGWLSWRMKITARIRWSTNSRRQSTPLKCFGWSQASSTQMQIDKSRRLYKWYVRIDRKYVAWALFNAFVVVEISGERTHKWFLWLHDRGDLPVGWREPLPFKEIRKELNESGSSTDTAYMPVKGEWKDHVYVVCSKVPNKYKRIQPETTYTDKCEDELQVHRMQHLPVHQRRIVVLGRLAHNGRVLTLKHQWTCHRNSAITVTSSSVTACWADWHTMVEYWHWSISELVIATARLLSQAHWSQLVRNDQAEARQEIWIKRSEKANMTASTQGCSDFYIWNDPEGQLHEEGVQEAAGCV